MQILPLLFYLANGLFCSSTSGKANKNLVGTGFLAGVGINPLVSVMMATALPVRIRSNQRLNSPKNSYPLSRNS